MSRRRRRFAAADDHRVFLHHVHLQVPPLGELRVAALARVAAGAVSARVPQQVAAHAEAAAARQADVALLR